jgi:hypothetical protein
MCSANKQFGFVLISTLTFIALAAFLALILFDMAESEKEMTNNFYQQQLLFKTVNQGLNEAYLQVKTGIINCQIPITSTYELKHKPAAWWDSSGVCHTNNVDYVVEALPVTNCMTVDDIHPAQFYRITIRASGQFGASLLTQAAYALGTNKLIHCPSAIKIISDCRQAWRFLV